MDWTKIYKKYKGLWVALADDEITMLGSGKTLVEAISKAKNKDGDNPIVMRVHEKMITFA
jgi:hypothetical protein